MRLFIRLFILLLLITVPIWLWYNSLTNSFEETISVDDELFYIVEDGSTLNSVAADLQEKGVIEKASSLKWLSRLEGDTTIFAAAYALTPEMTVREVYEAITQGKAFSDEVQVTIIEGLTLDQIGDQFEEAELVASDVFVTAASSGLKRFTNTYSFLADLPAGATLEGYLFPDTYRFFKDAEVDDIIKRMLDTFDARLTSEMRIEIAKSGRSIHEVVTLASIVQDEVRTEDQMLVVAGIFQNRLDAGMMLQSDATVNYITRSGRDRSTFEDLEIDSPYNTYKYAGLPPGPIGAPGSQALLSAVAPEKTDYFFFLTDKAGRVYYGETLADHNYNRQFLNNE